MSVPERIDIDELTAQVTAQIRQQGGRASACLRPVLEALVESEGHCNAEEIAAAVHARHPEIHQSTVYRNLERFEQLGVAYHAHLGHGPALWHLMAASHHHLTCEACGTIVAVDPTVFRRMRHTLQQQVGFVADFRHFAVTGRCASCAGSAGRPPLPS